MSRSYRKPYGTFCSIKSSAKYDKQFANRGARRKQNAYLKTVTDLDEVIIPHRYECAHNNVYDWNRDGRNHLMLPSNREWNDHWRWLNGLWDSEWERRYMEEHDSAWPPAWWLDIQRK